MKKNISINISGIIFHIEEDGYDRLKQYLDSIHKYFSGFDDSSEILADIESRIAEIFLGKLSEGKQVITADDVNSLIQTMGSVADFKAAEEAAQEEPEAKQTRQESYSGSGTQSTTSGTRRLVRDQKRKILGGVCAGLAYYLNVDPVWPRLIIALLALGSYGVLFLVYIILWIALPPAYDLDDQPSTKKMFRSSEGKVIAGVSGGLAAFFGIDIVVVRLLFVVFTLIGGLGFITYIVLWIVLPEARTITEKMQMQGEPVTLSNIESTVKKGLNVKEGEESTLTKILLFPFRVLGAILKGLGPVLRVLVDILRVGIGIIIVILGLSLLFALLVAAGVALGIFTGPDWLGWGWHEMTDLPIQAIQNSIPAMAVVSAVTACLAVAVSIFLLGISAIAGKDVIGKVVGWSLFVLFMLSIAVMSFTIPRVANSFREDGKYRIENSYDLADRTLVLRLNQAGLDDYRVADLSIRGYDEKTVKLVQIFESQGRNEKEAVENAQMVEYTVDVQDTVFTFASNIRFKEGASFHAQRLDLILYVPHGQQMVIGEEMERLLDISIWDGEKGPNTWEMTSRGLECASCGYDLDKEESSLDDRSAPLDVNDQYGLRGFTSLDISGIFDVDVVQGETYAIEITDNKDKKDVEIDQDGETVEIKTDYDKKWNWNRRWDFDDPIRVRITMPMLEELKVSGASKVDFTGFKCESLDLELAGAVKVRGDVDADELSAEVVGASELDLEGRGLSMRVKLMGASTFRGNDYEVERARVTAHGASRARVFVTDHLIIDKGMASSVDHRGGAIVDED
jgi:phage shock protein PspC (stress-responsive transcriptional regulator)